MARPIGTYNLRTQAPGLQRVWQSMRILRRFTVVDLMTTAELGDSAISRYVRALAKAGFLRLAQPLQNGHIGSRNVWQLVRGLDSPLAPIARTNRSAVFDPNTGVAWGSNGLPIADKHDHDAVAAALLAKYQDTQGGMP